MASIISNEEIKISEKPGTATMVHEIKRNGYHLVERKEKTNDEPIASDNTLKITKFIHSRSISLEFGIGYRFFDVHETLTEGEDVADRLVKTGINFKSKMNQGQVEEFVRDWSNLWKPKTNVDFPNLDSTRPALHTLPF